MYKLIVSGILSGGLLACASRPKPEARTPASLIDAQNTVTKKFGAKTQVIATGVVSSGTVPITFDVLCPPEAPEVYSGGCTISVGEAKPEDSGGVVTGLYPLLSAESGEGYRCIFGRTRPKNEIGAMAFCRGVARPRSRVVAE